MPGTLQREDLAARVARLRRELDDLQELLANSPGQFVVAQTEICGFKDALDNVRGSLWRLIEASSQAHYSQERGSSRERTAGMEALLKCSSKDDSPGLFDEIQDLVSGLLEKYCRT